MTYTQFIIKQRLEKYQFFADAVKRYGSISAAASAIGVERSSMSKYMRAWR